MLYDYCKYVNRKEETYVLNINPLKRHKRELNFEAHGAGNQSNFTQFHPYLIESSTSF